MERVPSHSRVTSFLGLWVVSGLIVCKKRTSPLSEVLQIHSRQRVTLPPRDVAVPSPLESLTAVFGMGTGGSSPLLSPRNLLSDCTLKTAQQLLIFFRSSPRPISTSQLKALLPLHTWPINLIIYEGSYQINSVGDLFLRAASHLDAFSAYPFRTWLSSRAPGGTTGTPVVRPSRSSRTRDSSSQISCARDR